MTANSPKGKEKAFFPLIIELSLRRVSSTSRIRHLVIKVKEERELRCAFSAAHIRALERANMTVICAWNVVKTIAFSQHGWV